MLKPSLHTESVISSTQKAPYFSPNAEGTGLPIADMYVYDHLDVSGQVLQANDTWKGCFVDVDHQLLFRRKDGASSFVHGQPEGWLFSLYHYKD